MSVFLHKSVNHEGEHVAGSIEAVDRRSAVSLLADGGLFVTELREDSGVQSGVVDRISAGGGKFRGIKFGGSRVRSKDILAMSAQLSAALRAGLPLLESLEIIRDQQVRSGMKKTLEDLARSVSSGQSLSESMSRHGKLFSPLYLSMVRVGETGGILEQTTTELVTILDRDEKIKTSMKNASAYPLFVLGLGFTSVVVIVTWILPKILGTMIGNDVLLPLPTRILLGMSGFMKSYWWLIGLLIIGGVSYFRKWSKGNGRLVWDGLKLRIPVLGSVLRTISVGRFARTLGALTRGGVTILESLAIVRGTLGNEVLGRAIDDVAEKVKSGSSLAGPLSESGKFPPLLVQITAIGEQTGKLDELLLGAADTFDGEADAAIQRFLAIFPAILILLLAVVIGFIIVATLLPILMMSMGAGVL